MFGCVKDVFYRFINNPNFAWRKFVYRINLQLLERVEKSNNHAEIRQIKCLIVDYTDLLKSGRCFELLSRIYSHVTHSFHYGLKKFIH
jgi:hypothetical protein